MEMPVYAKENSLIAYGDFKNNFAYDYADNAKIIWYSPVDNVPASARICDTDGRTVSELTAVKHGYTININYKLTAPKTFSLTVHGTDTIIKIDGTCLNGNIEVKI